MTLRHCAGHTAERLANCVLAIINDSGLLGYDPPNATGSHSSSECKSVGLILYRDINYESKSNQSRARSHSEQAYPGEHGLPPSPQASRGLSTEAGIGGSRPQSWQHMESGGDRRDRSGRLVQNIRDEKCPGFCAACRPTAAATRFTRADAPQTTAEVPPVQLKFHSVACFALLAALPSKAEIMGV